MLELKFLACRFLDVLQESSAGKVNLLRSPEVEKMDDDGNGKGKKAK